MPLAWCIEVKLSVLVFASLVVVVQLQVEDRASDTQAATAVPVAAWHSESGCHCQ